MEENFNNPENLDTVILTILSLQFKQVLVCLKTAERQSVSTSIRSSDPRRLVWVYTVSLGLQMPVLRANNVDSDKTLENAASDLALHCLIRPTCPGT